jgi:citronellol/citronellal dehydrogenase
MRLKDRVVVITGASRGVGAACAVACAREGAKLVIAAKTVTPDPRLPGTLLETAAACEALGAEVEVVPFDARDAEACEALIERTIARFQRIDVLINNAGAIFWAPVADWSQKKFDLVMGINVRAAFALSRAAIPYMRAAGYGHIVMMSPPINFAAAPGKAPYLLSKTGMTVLAMAIDAEEKEHGLAAHALWPVTGIKTAATVNLKHYFGDRDGLVEAITSVCHEDALPILARVSQPQGEDARSSLLLFFERLLLGWQHAGVGRLHEVGLSESLGDARLGPAFVNNILEPSLQSTEKLLAVLIERKHLPEMEVRAAALSLMSPVILALLHQGGLMGDRCRPLDVRDFIRVHVDHWLSGWAGS